jgi:hypothetical protein
MWVTLPYTAWWRWSRQRRDLPPGPGSVVTVVRHAYSRVGADGAPEAGSGWVNRDMVTTELLGDARRLAPLLDELAGQPRPVFAYIADGCDVRAPTVPARRLRAFLRDGPLGDATGRIAAMAGVLGVTATRGMDGFLADGAGSPTAMLDVLVEPRAAAEVAQALTGLVRVAVLTREAVQRLLPRPRWPQAPA